MTTTSSGVIIPRSPCPASAECTKNAGVPVEASVAASLRATCPDFPMPDTTTRPRQSRISCTALTNGSASRFASMVIARASVSSTSRASASARFASTVRLTTACAAAVCIAQKYTPREIGPSCSPCYRYRMPATLHLVLILLATAVVVVIACRLVRLPPILGYLAVGIALGPHALAWVPDDSDTHYLGEIGIVFLMFSIGLEFSLPQLRAMRRAVFGLGLAEVTITTLAGVAVLRLAGYGWQVGLVLGGMLAMSSTAIVSKMLAERMELGTPHGRDVMGILLFQDLAVVAFLILIPSLDEKGADVMRALGVGLAKAAVVLTLVLFFGQKPMRAWFHLVARLRSSELFVLNVLLVTLGLAALTQFAGLSMALGAFVAGMLIAETEFRYQVEEDIKPFRDVLLGLFFVVVGMALDLRVVLAHAGWVVVLLLIPVLAKLALIVVLSRIF